MASGNLELAHIIVNKYRFPDFVFGKGATQSIITRSNGLSLMVMGLSGAIAMPGFGFSRLLTGVTRITKFLRAGFDAWPVEMPY